MIGISHSLVHAHAGRTKKGCGAEARHPSWQHYLHLCEIKLPIQAWDTVWLFQIPLVVPAPNRLRANLAARHSSDASLAAEADEVEAVIDLGRNQLTRNMASFFICRPLRHPAEAFACARDAMTRRYADWLLALLSSVWRIDASVSTRNVGEPDQHVRDLLQLPKTVRAVRGAA